MLEILKELKEFLKERIEEFNVVVMPDFFLDRFISLKWNIKTFSENLWRIIQRKGGSIDDIEQADFRGGNAINTASALAALDVKVTPIVCIDAIGLQLLKYYLKLEMVDFSHVKVFNKASMTTAIEFETKGGKVNVMLRDVGALASFGPHHLSKDDFDVMENADYVCVFNWAGTKRFGTELAKTVFRHVKAKGNGKTYYDSADPTPNRHQVSQLIMEVLQSGNVDILSLNENEAVCYASYFTDEVKALAKRLPFEELAKESARILAAHLSARIDLHTTNFAATFTKKSETIIPAFRVPVRRVTGAGDAWNAGNILGDAYGFSDDCRLALANAVAAYYISNPNKMHPTRKQLVKFFGRLKMKA
ncbi:MAG: carbohydrate kinase family protein [Candidatus Bathyarchaeota archaeon]|nr:carbohydrate kinase family protein [Candidatus Bathyarchaeota archaeon]